VASPQTFTGLCAWTPLGDFPLSPFTFPATTFKIKAWIRRWFSPTSVVANLPSYNEAHRRLTQRHAVRCTRIFNYLINEHHYITRLLVIGHFRLRLQRAEDPSLGEKVWPFTSGLSRSLNVFKTDTDRAATYDFLLVFHSNCGSILYRLRDEGRYLQKLFHLRVCTAFAEGGSVCTADLAFSYMRSFSFSFG